MTASGVVAGSSGVIEFAGAQLSRTVTVTARADGSYEGYEPVRLVLSPPAAGSGYWVQSDSAAQLLIYNNDGSSAPPAHVSAAAGSVSEGSQVRLTVELKRLAGAGAWVRRAVADTKVLLEVATAGTTAGAGDYELARQWVLIPKGQSRATVTLAALVDMDHDDRETVTVKVAAPPAGANPGPGYLPAAQLYTAGSGQAAVTIRDRLAVSVAASKAQVTEGDDTARFTVALSKAAASQLTVSYALSGAATQGTAAAGGDFTLRRGTASGARLAGTVTIPAGQTSATIAVDTHDDALDERDEHLRLTLASGTGYLVAQPAAARLAIADNDTIVTLAGFEVTQGTQDWSNTVALVSGRDTVVRVFATAPWYLSAGARAAVRLTAQGHTERLAPLADGTAVTQLPRSIRGDCVADGYARTSSCRGDLDSSLNFVLPLAWTKPAQTTAATHDLRLTLEFPSSVTTLNCPATGTCAAGGGQRSYTKTVSFTTVTPPKLVFIAAPVKLAADPASPNKQRDYPAPTLAELKTQAQRVMSQMPFPAPCTTANTTICTTIEYNHLVYDDGEVDKEDSTLDTPIRQQPKKTAKGDPDKTMSDYIEEFQAVGASETKRAVRDHLRRVEAAGEGTAGIANSVYVAVTKCPVSDVNCDRTHHGGIADLGLLLPAEDEVYGFAVAVWNIGTTAEELYYARSALRNVGAHEVGHALGQRHPHVFLQPTTELSHRFCSNASETFRRADRFEFPAGQIAKATFDPPGLLGFSQNPSNADEYAHDINRDGRIDARVTAYRNLGWGAGVPLLGPIGAGGFDPATEVWGLDIHALKGKYGLAGDATLGAYDSAAHPRQENERLITANPRQVFELMSYCWNQTASHDAVQGMWLSQRTHSCVLGAHGPTQSPSPHRPRHRLHTPSRGLPAHHQTITPPHTTRDKPPKETSMKPATKTKTATAAILAAAAARRHQLPEQHPRHPAPRQQRHHGDRPAVLHYCRHGDPTAPQTRM